MASPPGDDTPPASRVGDSSVAVPDLGTTAAPFLSAGACLELLSGLYPISASMLFFNLEAFLRERDSATPAGEVSVPRRVLLANAARAVAGGAPSGSMTAELMADVVVECPPDTQGCSIELVPSGAVLIRGRPQGQGVHGGMLHVHVHEDAGLSKRVSVPLQVLISGWGEVSGGYKGFVHAIEFADELGGCIERWSFVGVTSGNWMSRMDDFEREIRTGAKRRFGAAWQKYVGAAKIVLHSELVKVNQWEEREIRELAGAGGNLNVIPGGEAGMRELYARGVLVAPRVPIEVREAALTSWAAHPDDPIPPSGLPHLVRRAWQRDRLVRPGAEGGGEVLTPAQVVRLRTLWRSGESAESIAIAIGAGNLSDVQAAIAELDAGS
jgi:hypothetical protein